METIWRSQKQRVVACSTTKAEYISLAEATKESLWIHRLFSKVCEEELQLPVKIYVDNTSAIRLANNPEFHQRSKHIDVAYRLSRSHVQNGFLEVDYVSSANQVADGFTKPLPAAAHEKMKANLGMESCSKSSLPTSKLSAMFCYFLTMALLVHPAISTLSSSSYIMWRPTDVPVVTGYNNVHLLVKLEDPCSLFNGTVHPDLQNE